MMNTSQFKKNILALLLCLVASACASNNDEEVWVAGDYGGTPAKSYIVQKGDTLSKVAKKNNTTVASLAIINKLNKPYKILAGQRLYLSKPTEKQAKGNKYYDDNVVTGKQKSITQTQNDAPIPPSVKSSERFIWPVKGQVISSFGQKNGGQRNDGINIAAKAGEKIKVADDGKVVYVGNEVKGFGNLILVRHDDAWVTAYAHTDKIDVKKGQSVKKGDIIATVGQTGAVSSPQLHLETRYRGKPVDPMTQMAKQ